MGSTTTLRLGNLEGARTAPATGEAGRAEGPGFLSMLAAARGGCKRQEAVAAAAEPDASEKTEDPAMAALLAAMLPGLSPAATQEANAGSDLADAPLDDGKDAGISSTEGLLADGAVLAEGSAQALEEALLAHLVPSLDQEVASDENATLSRLGGDLASAVENLVPELRAAPELRAPAMVEGQPANVFATGVAPAGTASVAGPAPGGGTQPLRLPVGSPRWADELGSRLVMMSTRGQHEGSLTLAPEHLGPLEVRISLQQNTASVWFGAQHADTRAALAEALPRLRELFADAGLSLGHAGVSQEAPRRELQQAAPARPSASEDPVGQSQGETSVSPTRHAVSGLLDLYA